MLEVLGGFQEANPPDPPPARRLRSQDPAGENQSRDMVAYHHYPLWECVLLVMRLLHNFERILELPK